MTKQKRWKVVLDRGEILEDKDLKGFDTKEDAVEFKNSYKGKYRAKLVQFVGELN